MSVDGWLLWIQNGLLGVGCVMFEIIGLFPLFPRTDELDQINKIHNVLGTPSKMLLEKFKRYATHMDFNFPHKEGTGIAKMIPHVSSECIDLITNLLMYNPEDRMSARQALKHPYFREMYVKDKARSKDASSSNEKSNRNKDGRSGKDGRSRSNRQSGQRDNAGNAQAKKTTSRTSPRAAQSEKIPRDPKRDKAEGDQAQKQRTTEKAAEKKKESASTENYRQNHATKQKGSSKNGSSYVSSNSGKSKHNYRRYGGNAKDSNARLPPIKRQQQQQQQQHTQQQQNHTSTYSMHGSSTIQSTRKNSAI